jgi:hypothetical protein
MMKKSFFIFFSFCGYQYALSQEIPLQDAFEQIAQQESPVMDEETYYQAMENYQTNPLDLNIAEASDLQQFSFLSALQIASFLTYRKYAGKLLVIYELQAVPLWDKETIQKLLPYVKTGNQTTVKEDFLNRLRKGGYTFLTRLSLKSGLLPDNYIGSREQVLSRFQYRYGNTFQWGITGEKDPGERWFGRTSTKGFDFYSAHLFLKNLGGIKSFVLGDYSVNIGQGLIHWQSIAFRKSPDILQIKRQAPVLRPYNSSGEVFFQRGAGMTIGKNNWSATFLYSSKKMDGSVVYDSVKGENLLKSWKIDGFHRTTAEISLKNKWRLNSYGISFHYGNAKRNVSLNALHYQMSAYIQKSDLPYQHFAFKGTAFTNFSADWSITHKNIHWFGEAAVHRLKAPAIVTGFLASLDARLSFSFVWRKISPVYQSLFGNAFTEASSVTNESGIFAGISLKPSIKWKIDGYVDFFRFPWLKYNKDAPSSGSDFFVQVTHRLGKEAEIITRYRVGLDSDRPLHDMHTDSRQQYQVSNRNWRTQFQIKLTSALMWRARVEINWIYSGEKEPEQGFLTYADLIYKPMMKPYSAGFRFQFFETDSYASRIYAYENDVLFRFSIPSFQGKGKRYYLNFQYNFHKKVTFWLRWSQMIYSKTSSYLPAEKNETGLNVQIMYRF